MASTPRKSSIRSSTTPRAPFSLRLPSTGSSRRASNPHLSLVFAKGDSTPSSCSSGGGGTEEKLQRHLDGDGRNIGLRSRRGSSATVRTTRTVSVSTPSVAEEEEGKADMENSERRQNVTDGFHGTSIAGPSSERAPVESPQDMGEREGESERSRSNGRSLNPKYSSSWLRWNSPAPTFPRSPSGSRDKGKGKEREEPPSPPQVEPRTNKPSQAEPPVDAKPIVPTLTEPIPPNLIPDATEKSQFNQTSLAETSPPTTIPAPPPRGRWWSRQNPASQPNPIDPETLAPIPTPSDAKAPVPSSSTETTTPSDLTSTQPPKGSAPPVPVLSLAPPAPLAPESERPVAATETPQKAPETVRGWRGFIWGGGEQVLPDVVPAIQNGHHDDPPTDQLIADAEPSKAASTHSTAEASAPVSTPPIDPPQSLTQAQPPKGWGSYLYSYVAPTKLAALPSEPSPSHAVDPSSPTEDQKPVPTPATPPSVSIQASTPVPHPPNGSPGHDHSEPSRKASVASQQSGWLNYLAFRASQKKIANGSTASIKSGKERRSMDTTTGEEVMDFSNDPDFPVPPPKSKIEDEALAKKASQNLAVKKSRRLSTNSTASGSLTTLSSSPKASGREAKPHPTSALPAPPLVPTPPNFVIPSFSTTFDRPPRSLPPLTDEKSITAATTGLAWKAIGAMGSYVYGGGGSGAVKAGGGEEKPGVETRGMKEGRRIGGDLPRKLGLIGSKEDEGWRNVKRVVVVGVHGWFPAKMLNSVIGEPTGTSVKFANMMGAAVKKFFEENGVEEKEIRLTLMPLEGEGTIDSRVDKLYKAYLSNPAWINDLRRADAIFFAAHSQGCIVTTHLISRMIAQGHIRTPLNTDAVNRCEWAFGPIGVVPDLPKRRGLASSLHITGAEGGYQKVAMLAMCGVHLGPLYSISTSTVIQPYLQWFENAAARELFEFQDSNSAVSLAYQKALSMILENAVKLVLLASLNDQVVPIYGASFSTANHPLILRALFVDGASYSNSDFMTNLLAFAFMLRNAGIEDQRLVEHLSEATAGSLTGVGHSAPYEDPGCYNLTVQYLFLAGPLQHPSPPLSIEPFTARETRNDFELPWIMRALVDSLEVRDLFDAELRDLKEGVVAWKPVTKALKEIKKRLEPMAGRQSKLRPMTSSPSSTSLNEIKNGSTGAASGLRKDW